jgi:hypothetical protein
MSKWSPPPEVVKVEQRLERTEEIYRALWLALYLRARGDETLPSEVAVVVCLDLVSDLAEHSGLLWSTDYDSIAELRRHADHLQRRWATEPPRPLIGELLAVLKARASPPATETPE